MTDALTGAGTTPNFVAKADDFGGTEIVVCFAAGTRIRIVGGDVAVEMLRVGDRVVTASGTARPVRWLGHRTIDCRRHPRPAEAWPVRIPSHAFGEGVPCRDLRLSPAHAVCVDVLGEVLIPAITLLDGVTIAQVETAPSPTGTSSSTATILCWQTTSPARAISRWAIAASSPSPASSRSTPRRMARCPTGPCRPTPTSADPTTPTGPSSLASAPGSPPALA